MTTDVWRVLTSRKTVHSYRTDPVPEGSLERALRAAVAAPNHRMTEPWRFTSVGPETRRQLAEIAVRIKERQGKATTSRARQDIVAAVLDPPELLVVSRVRHEDPVIEREDSAAVACAVQNVALSLWSEGVGSKWSTGAVTRAKDTYALLGIDEAVEEIFCFVWAGYDASDKPKVPRKLSLAQVTRGLP